MPKVFISHQKKDIYISKRIADQLELQGVETFLDVYDPNTGSSASPLDEYIIEVLEGCSHFLTILSTNTQESWWVPFEIGVATEKDIPIANYFHERIKVPDYLLNWPYLLSLTDLSKYIQLIKKGRRRILFDHKVAGMESRYTTAFHNELRSILGH